MIVFLVASAEDAFVAENKVMSVISTTPRSKVDIVPRYPKSSFGVISSGAASRRRGQTCVLQSCITASDSEYALVDIIDNQEETSPD